VISITTIVEGINKQSKIATLLGIGLFIILHIFSVFIKSKRFTKLRYIPILNIAGVIENIKIKIQWKLFLIANLFIMLTIVSILSIVIWKQILLGVVLFMIAYLGGVGFFLYAGKKKGKSC
ncbi:MAG: hypothetical protein KOO69_00865, partial [Victivallales bacterium]|nr:hypothetical protein [Victivallales bacterium]